MDSQVIYNHGYGGYRCEEAEMIDVRKGPWTIEEDTKLTEYVSVHGEGRWNSAAQCAGLRRTGKSCRLRWLNYLRPNVRRGNITLQEQLLILELHSRWGNRWSKIAQYLPGRTDNEIKNYWRTRVQKQAKQLKCEVNSKEFRDAMRHVWIPRLLERIQAAAASDQSPADQQPVSTVTNCSVVNQIDKCGSGWVDPNFVPETSVEHSDSLDTNQVSSNLSGITECQNQVPYGHGYEYDSANTHNGSGTNIDSGYWSGYQETAFLEDDHLSQNNAALLMDGGDSLEGFWNDEEFWVLQQQFSI